MTNTSLNKFIAASGYCSRREADLLIEEGRVTVNDMLGTLTMRVGPKDVVAVDFEVIKKHTIDQTIILAYNKPEGLTSTMDLEDKSSIMHFIKYPKRIFPIGRLDKDSTGLLLFTNNGDLVNKILRSSNEHEKEYIVTLKAPYEKGFLQQLAAGVKIDYGYTKPCKTKALAPRTFSIILTQGLNRQIRKMCAILGAKVDTLQRVRIMQIQLGTQGTGKLRKLNDVEAATLLQNLGNSTNSKVASKTRVERPETIYKPKPKPDSKKDSRKDTKKEYGKDTGRSASKVTKAPVKYKSYRGSKTAQDGTSNDTTPKVMPKKGIAKKPTSATTSKPKTAASKGSYANYRSKNKN